MFKFERLLIVLMTIAVTITVIWSQATRYIDGRISVVEECIAYKHIRVNGVHYECHVKQIPKDD